MTRSDLPRIAPVILLSPTAMAGLTDVQLNEFVGYTIIANKTIVGWYDNDGKKGDSFEGCNFNRVIVFDDNRSRGSSLEFNV